MLILKGKSDAMREMEESEEARRLLTKAHAIVNDLKAHWYVTGDAVQEEVSLFAQVTDELGLS
jgi:predicted esterase